MDITKINELGNSLCKILSEIEEEIANEPCEAIKNILQSYLQKSEENLFRILEDFNYVNDHTNLVNRDLYAAKKFTDGYYMVKGYSSEGSKKSEPKKVELTDEQLDRVANDLCSPYVCNTGSTKEPKKTEDSEKKLKFQFDMEPKLVREVIQQKPELRKIDLTTDPFELKYDIDAVFDNIHNKKPEVKKTEWTAEQIERVVDSMYKRLFL